MKQRLAMTVTAVAVLAAIVTSFVWFREQAAAQGGVPDDLRQIIFQGNVTVAGEPAPNGLKVTAKIRNRAGEVVFVSQPATIGDSSPSRYVTLVVGPATTVEGETVEFWLDDQVISTNTSVFAPTLNNVPCLGCSWSLPILRTQNLDFPRLPVATPTPTPTLTPTVVIAQPSLYAGRVLAGSTIPPDGTPIFAKIADYTSPFAEIEDGRYQLVVNPVSEQYIGQPVIFFIGEFRAIQGATFQGGEFLENFNLVFSDIPPSPTPTPSPSATPEPTRTPTPSPSPTPTATPTVSPTPIGTATPTADEKSGGFCSARSGGPASLGVFGMIMAPLGLFLLRKWQRSGGFGRDE